MKITDLIKTWAKRLATSKAVWALIIITIIGGYLRSYKLVWDEGLYFHPDERNIAFGVTNIDPEAGDYNPNFFAYGALPIYIVRYLSGGEFTEAIYYGRVVSAFLSTLIIPLTYLCMREIINNKRSQKLFPNRHKINVPALAAAALVAFTPGMIQFAHYATFEIFLTFEYMLAAYAALRLLRAPRAIWYGLFGLGLGAAAATKIVSFALWPSLILIHIAIQFNAESFANSGGQRVLAILKKIFLDWRVYFAIFVALAAAFALSPYNVLDREGYTASMNYEGPVARGTLEVFYTQQYYGTVPVFYQLTRIFPYILGVPVLILFVLSVLWLILKSVGQSIDQFYKLRKIRVWPQIFIAIFALLYLGSHFTLYVKWSRYMIPALPFMCLLAIDLIARVKWRKIVIATVLAFQVMLAINFSYIYFQRDPRIMAGEWARQNIESDAMVLSEIYDLGIIPWNSVLPVGNIELFNFYDLDVRDTLPRLSDLKQEISKADYIVIPSNRIYPIRFRNPQKYPLAKAYYEDLFSGELGFELVAKFDRPTLWQKFNQSDDFAYSPTIFEPDESHRVFDAPQILVFKRIDK